MADDTASPAAGSWAQSSAKALVLVLALALGAALTLLGGASPCGASS